MRIAIMALALCGCATGLFAVGAASVQELLGGLNERVLAEGMDRPVGSHKKQLARIEALFPDATEMKGGLRYFVLKPGEGDAKPSRATRVTAHYTGALLDGTVFDSSVERGEPIRFRVGTGRVIPGWDQALLDMTKGERRILIVPSRLGYGPRGAGGGSIPGNAILVFEVELVDFGKR